MRVSGDGSVDFDTLPLTVEESGDYSFTTGSGQLQGGITTSLAAWPGPGAPTAAQCENLLRTQPVSSLEDHTGLIFCAEGTGVLSPHVGFGEVMSYDGNTSQVNVTVWTATLKS
jgi:hypothetical protein